MEYLHQKKRCQFFYLIFNAYQLEKGKQKQNMLMILFEIIAVINVAVRLCQNAFGAIPNIRSAKCQNFRIINEGKYHQKNEHNKNHEI